jgi:hypothetical protein
LKIKGDKIMKKRYKVTATHTWEIEFEVDLDNPETKDILKSYNECISKGSDIEDVLQQLVFGYFVRGWDFVEGIGNIFEVEEKKAIVIIKNEEDSDYEIEEIK